MSYFIKTTTQILGELLEYWMSSWNFSTPTNRAHVICCGPLIHHRRCGQSTDRNSSDNPRRRSRNM